MSDKLQNDSVLQHHGILGQRWGVRRTEAQLARGRKFSEESDDHKKTTELKQKPLSSLSNDELKVLNSRLQAETQYKNLNKKQISVGRKYINNMGKALAGTASAATIAVGSKYVNKLVTPIAEKTAQKTINKTAALAAAHMINKAVRKM